MKNLGHLKRQVSRLDHKYPNSQHSWVVSYSLRIWVGLYEPARPTIPQTKPGSKVLKRESWAQGFDYPKISYPEKYIWWDYYSEILIQSAVNI